MSWQLANTSESPQSNAMVVFCCVFKVLKFYLLLNYFNTLVTFAIVSSSF